MASPRRSYVPRLNPTCKVRDLPLTAHEGFILSRIDGFTSSTDLGLLTGLGDDIEPILAKLQALGALLDVPDGVGGSSTPPAPAGATLRPTAGSATVVPPARISAPTGTGGSTAGMQAVRAPVDSLVPPRAGTPAPRAASVVPSRPTPAPVGSVDGTAVASPAMQSHTVRPRYSAEELTENVDIEPERRLRVLELFYGLDDLNYYELLGVEPTADKKAIKKAYYDLAQEFHPDRYFRKELGSYKARLEAIFKRLTEAHDTLTRNALRSVYDAELAQRPRPATPPLNPVRLAPSNAPNLPVSVAKSPSVRPAAPASSAPPPGHDPVGPRPPSSPRNVAGGAPTRPPSSPRNIAAQRPPSVGGTPVTSSPRPPAPETSSSLPPGPDAEARRRALAARLSGHFTPPRVPSIAPPDDGSTPSAEERASNARDTLRRMAIGRQVQQQRSQVERYIAVAEESILRDDPLGAANALRLAATIEPGNEELAARAREWAGKAAVALAEHHLKIGDNESQLGRWAEAARAYVRAVDGRPDDVNLLDKAARTLMLAGGDLHRAADLARRAVELRPNVARHRVTLAEVYLAANLALNARRELAEAARLSPDDEKVKALRKSLG